jgi:hypothetical protein
MKQQSEPMRVPERNGEQYELPADIWWVVLQKAGEKALSCMAGMNRPLPIDKRLF